MQVAADEKKKLDEFFEINSYIQGSYDTAADFKKLDDAIVKLAKPGANRLFYLALPPSTYESVATMIKATCMSRRSVKVCCVFVCIDAVFIIFIRVMDRKLQSYYLSCISVFMFIVVHIYTFHHLSFNCGLQS